MEQDPGTLILTWCVPGTISLDLGMGKTIAPAEIVNLELLGKLRVWAEYIYIVVSS